MPLPTNDIGSLLAALADHRVAIPAAVEESRALTPFVVKYWNASLDAVTYCEAEEAIRVAAAVLSWATELANRG